MFLSSEFRCPGIHAELLRNSTWWFVELIDYIKLIWTSSNDRYYLQSILILDIHVFVSSEFHCPGIHAELLRNSTWCVSLLVVQMSKESTLSDAIDHIKKLQNQVLELQRQLADSPGEAWEKQGSASCSESFTATENMPYQVIIAAVTSWYCKYGLAVEGEF